MEEQRVILTAESVTEGHPDKLCDLIADRVLDACLEKDADARVACEVVGTAGKVFLAGEITVKEMPDIPAVISQTIKECSDMEEYEIEIAIHEQSKEIHQAVDQEQGLGAGDQGVMIGYATNETEEMLPLPCVLAHRITRELTLARMEERISGIGPDGKAQVSVEYLDGEPQRIAAIVVSCQHAAGKNVEELRHEIATIVLPVALSLYPADDSTEIHINPSGQFTQGGFMADTGLTGRKLMVDAYGPLVPHGGGSWSGKDGTKVDRSGAYMARYVAKQVVVSGLADQCVVTLAYAIGKPEPVSIEVNTLDTGEYADDLLTQAVRNLFDFRPEQIIWHLQLKEPLFALTTNYGHFGKEYLPWEQIDMAMRFRYEVEKLDNENKSRREK